MTDPVRVPEDALAPVETVYHGRWLSMRRRGRWEFAERNNPGGAVIILAVTPADRVLFHTADTQTLQPAIGPRVVAVGPEGGFTDDEVKAAAGWTVASLGTRILRTETAAIASCMW